ncbi:MAG: LysR family transcriptional regulator [Treponema sp.]|nr:LysR family transcriptional regulator [Treponema sp.]
MTIQQLRYVIGIAESGSFNKAAEKLYISQPSLTSTIHDLENELGIMIFSRSGRGVTLTQDGEEFLSSAKQLYLNYETVMERYKSGAEAKKKFGISTQHYSFALKSFVEMVKRFNTNEYEFAIRETRTKEVIEDVASLKSQIGILYLSDFNRNIIQKLLNVRNLEFHPLIDCKAYVYIWKGHPLAKHETISFEKLADYPCLSFEQDDNDSVYFAEEILATQEYHRTIKTNDRASMLNLMVGLNGYTLCSGIISEELNGDDYVAVPFRESDKNINRIMEIGYITKKDFIMSKVGTIYIEEMKKYLKIEK